MGPTSAAGAQRTAPGAPGRSTPSPEHSSPHRGPRPRRDAPPVQRITTAPVGQRQHQQQQIGRYLLSMGIRTVCVILAFLVPSPWQWVLVAFAVVLPYIAVLVANAGRETARPTTTQVTAPPQPALRSAPTRPVEEPLVGHVTEAPVPGARPHDAGTSPSSASPGGPASASSPRSWDTERLRPPADLGSGRGGSGRAGSGRAGAGDAADPRRAA